MMDAQTIRRLNQINQDFYRAVADDFDQTRGDPWPGWARLTPYLQAPLSVLDVGCGNGRFGLFLGQNLTPNAALSSPPPSPLPATQGGGTEQSDSEVPLYEVGRDLGRGENTAKISKHEVTYHGQDSSADLLEHARVALAAQSGIDYRLEQRDIVENPPDVGEYDLVALFGVLHHIPGYDERQNLMRRLGERVKPGGLLVFTTWRFYEVERYRERISPWPEDIAVEQNDYLLDWRRGTVSLRYCHYADDAEHAALAAVTGMQEVLAYRDDGPGRATNAYSLLKKR